MADPVVPPLPLGFSLDNTPALPAGFVLDQPVRAATPLPAAPQATNTAVVVNAANKAVAGLPDMFLNAPNQVLNLGRAVYGTAATALGHSESAPALTPNPDFARRILETMGAINPNIVPTGATQKTTDALVQGAVGGAVTGGRSIVGAGVGAALGALSSGAQVGTEAATGNRALGISAGLAVPWAAGKVFSPGTPTPDAKTLSDVGVQLTPGQIMGGSAKRIEDSLTSIPLLGDAIKASQRRGHESYGTIAINRALQPIGEALPSGIKGNDAIGYAQDRLGARYDALQSKMGGSLDGSGVQGTPNVPAVQGQAPTLRQELTRITSMGTSLPEKQRTELNDIVNNEIIGQFSPAGKASGETIKNIESQLGGMASDFMRSDSYHVRQLGGAIKEAQAALRRMVYQENPQYADELQKINQGYANFKTLQRAASSVAASNGVFTPAQLHAAVKAQDFSKDKSRFARGDALMQDLSQPGKNVLSSSVPDSGTATRALVEAAALGGLGHLFNHPVAAGGALLTTLPYTPLGQRAAQAFLTRGGSPELANIANRVGAVVTPLSLADLLRQQQ